MNQVNSQVAVSKGLRPPFRPPFDFYSISKTPEGEGEEQVHSEPNPSPTDTPSDTAHIKLSHELQEKEGFGELSLSYSQTAGGLVPEERQSQNQSRKKAEESSHLSFHNENTHPGSYSG